MGSHKESQHSDMSKLQLCASNAWDENFKNIVLSKRKTAIEKYTQYPFHLHKFHKHSQPHNKFFSCTYAGGKNFKEKQGVG